MPDTCPCRPAGFALSLIFSLAPTPPAMATAGVPRALAATSATLVPPFCPQFAHGLPTSCQTAVNAGAEAKEDRNNTARPRSTHARACSGRARDLWSPTRDADAGGSPG
ncbi:hypothetical protein B0H67DRAFT_557019 [Lasiosphaeris hirsuta]|uniref:Secreted protein n=1 Tax=Lasiosphaeris hirsuta TaxID=260670 RepID=A0AA40A3G0_9PEZI|nr:hypothetical protein B0H67DRAFT_557019 [Lasiosphaeris hirsuta]